MVSQKNLWYPKKKDFANERQVKQISTSLEPSIPCHPRVNMVDPEDDITLEKSEIQEISLEINTLPYTFIQNATVTDNSDNSSEPPQVQTVDPNNKSKPQFKKILILLPKKNHSVATCYRRIKCLRNLNPNLDHLLLPFLNILKRRIVHITTKLLIIVVEVPVTTFSISLENLDANLVLTLVQTLARNILIPTLFITVLVIMIKIDLVMINIIAILLTEHIIHHAHTIFLHLFLK